MEISTETFKKSIVRTTNHVEYGEKMDHVYTHSCVRVHASNGKVTKLADKLFTYLVRRNPKRVRVQSRV